MLSRASFPVGKFGQIISARSAHTEVQLSQALRDKYYPKIGNRDIVGYGFNGNANYMDSNVFPCPAVRFKENSKEIVALRTKEQGDWKNLSLEEKKTLYRASFRQTLEEVNAPNGEWKSVAGIVLFGMSLTMWIFYWIHHGVLPELPHTISAEWQEKQLEHMIKIRQGAVEGPSSKWDYENNTWK